MSLQGATFNKGNVGPNVAGSADGTSAMILPGVAVATLIALNEMKELRRLKDAEALGLTKEYDAANNIRVWYHIKEFYRLAGDGVKLFIMLVDNTVTAGDLNLTLAATVEDAGGIHCKKMVIDAEGEIKLFGFAMNPAAGYIETILDGLDADVQAAIPKAQAFAQWAWASDRSLNVFLEGRSFTGTGAAAQDLRDITDLLAEEVSVIIGQDWNYADDLDALGQKHACLGTYLGAMARIRVNQNPGEVETMNLTNATTGDFLVAGLSGHQKSSEMEDDLVTLDEKGYNFTFRYTDWPGVYFNNDHTCTPIIIDSEGNHNHHQASYGRTVGKAARKLRQRMLPKVKSVQRIDPVTGKLDGNVIKFFDALGDEVFKEMEEAAEVSTGKTYTDPDSNLLTPPRVLDVSFSVVPYGTIDKISGFINLKNSL